MNGILGIYEIAIPVKDLERAEAFYLTVLGLESGLREEDRRWHFLQVGHEGMVVLQETQGQWLPTHYAFRTTDAELASAAERLREFGITVDGPVEHGWIPARSIYFADPDGHALELCAPLEST